MNRQREKLVWLGFGLGLAAVCAGGLAYAADPPSADALPAAATPATPTLDLRSTVQNAQVFTFDYSVPTSPALTLAGLSADKTATSTPAKPFVFSSPTVTGGGTGTAYAVDVAPFWIAGRDSESDYVNDDILPILYRTRISAAAYQGNNGGGTPSKAAPSQVAFGLSTSLLRYNDPILATAPAYSGTTAFEGCLQSEVVKLNQATSPGAVPDSNLHLTSAFTPAQTQDDRNNTEAQVLMNVLTYYGDTGKFYKVDPVTLKKTELGPADARTAALAAIDAAETLLGKPPTDQSDAAIRSESDAALRENALEAVAALTAAKPALDAKVQAALDPAYQKLAAPIVKSCVTAANNAAQQGAALDVGLGGVLAGTPGAFSDFQKPSASTWLGFRVPFPTLSGTKTADTTALTSYWAVGGSVHYTYQGMVSTGSTATPKIQANSTDAWGALEYFSDWIKLEAEAGYTDVSAVERSQSTFSKSGVRWLATTDVKVPYLNSSAVWVSLAYGNANSANSTLKGKEFLLSLNFGPPAVKDLFGIGSP